MSQDTTKFSLEELEGLAELLPAPESVDVTIELLDDSFGDQLEADRLPWNAFVFDIRNNLIELSVGGRDRRVPVVFRHSIHNPTGIWLEQEHGLPVALMIEAEGGPRTIVRFHRHAALGTGNDAVAAPLSLADSVSDVPAVDAQGSVED